MGHTTSSGGAVVERILAASSCAAEGAMGTSSMSNIVNIAPPVPPAPPAPISEPRSPKRDVRSADVVRLSVAVVVVVAGRGVR
jgi:hypothetical protein